MAALILLLSLKRHNVQAHIRVLGIGLKPCESEFLEQFEECSVMPADLNLPLSPAGRKGEALLKSFASTQSQFLTLVDSDCVVIGDITPYLTHDAPWFLWKNQVHSRGFHCFCQSLRAWGVRGDPIGDR